MRETKEIGVAEERRLLIERIAASPYFNRSTRLKDLLHYLAERVLEGEAEEVREQEVGHKVFGRPANYDTTADNIVRVHASMLRKRLEQYFALEGASEPIVVEIPKGNYAPVFHPRALPLPERPPDVVIDRPRSNWLVWILAATTVLFAGTTLWVARSPRAPAAKTTRPIVALFWSNVFAANRLTDLVVDDAAVGLYQELTGKEISLTSYFDRSYLRTLGDEPEAKLILRRQSSYANSSFLWKLMQIPEADHWREIPRFARDYSFRELKANNAILPGKFTQQPVDPGIRAEDDDSVAVREVEWSVLSGGRRRHRIGRGLFFRGTAAESRRHGQCADRLGDRWERTERRGRIPERSPQPCRVARETPRSIGVRVSLLRSADQPRRKKWRVADNVGRFRASAEIALP